MEAGSSSDGFDDAVKRQLADMGHTIADGIDARQYQAARTIRCVAGGTVRAWTGRRWVLMVAFLAGKTAALRDRVMHDHRCGRAARGATTAFMLRGRHGRWPCAARRAVAKGETARRPACGRTGGLPRRLISATVRDVSIVRDKRHFTTTTGAGRLISHGGAIIYMGSAST